MVIGTSGFAKMKEQLPFCREFRTLCIEGRIVVEHVVYLWNRSST